jgi:two-component system nitrate/nitrite response regulator NarL
MQLQAPSVARGSTPPESALIVLVDANATVRRGTELLLRSHGHHVVGVAADAGSGLELIRRRKPHVAIVDAGLPGAAELARSIVDADPNVGVIVNLDSAGGGLQEILDCEPAGLAVKSGEPRELFDAVASVSVGGHYVTPSAMELVTSATRVEAPLLTPREREILQLLADGLNGHDVSATLSVSPETVRTHIRNATRKLGATTRVHAVTMAIARHEVQL